MFEPETSAALGFGFRCGFLGLLPHMEIIEERLECEFNLDLITTAPSVVYQITKRNGEVVYIDNPTNYPASDEIDVAAEPIVSAIIITPTEYVGNIMELCQDRRGTLIDMKYIDAMRAELHYELPLNEIVYDLLDALKSPQQRPRLPSTMSCKAIPQAMLVKLDILLNGEVVDALSFIVHEYKVYARGRRIAEKLKEKHPAPAVRDTD